MKIAIMGAMREEIEPILENVGEYQTFEHAGNVFYTCTYGAHELTIAYSKIGKVFSAITASVMIERFGAQVLLFSGVAGGILGAVPPRARSRDVPFSDGCGIGVYGPAIDEYGNSVAGVMLLKHIAMEWDYNIF